MVGILYFCEKQGNTHCADSHVRENCGKIVKRNYKLRVTNYKAKENDKSRIYVCHDIYKNQAKEKSTKINELIKMFLFFI
jgi:hypothetical protein